MLVEPLLPIEVPFDWTILQKDQYRRSLSLTPGLTGVQSCNSWLSQSIKMVQLLVRVMFRIRWEVVAPSLSVVNWIQARLTLYDKAYRPVPAFTTLSSLPVLEAGILLCENYEMPQGTN